MIWAVHPAVVVLTVDDHMIEVAAAGSKKYALLGPFTTERNERG